MSYVDVNLQALDGPESEQAFHNLLELGVSVFPRLREAFRVESSSRRRAEIVEIVWNLKAAGTLDFLGTALEDSEAEVWKAALDGIVAISGSEAEKLLLRVSAGLETFPANRDKREWIEEALDQIRH